MSRAMQTTTSTKEVHVNYTIGQAFISEVLGTGMLILLGAGVVANVIHFLSSSTVHLVASDYRLVSSFLQWGRRPSRGLHHCALCI